MKKLIINMLLFIILSFFIAIFIISISHYFIYKSLGGFIVFNLKNGVIEIISITTFTLIGINHK